MKVNYLHTLTLGILIPNPGLKLLVLSVCMLYNTDEQFRINFACVHYICYLMQYKDIHWKQITTELTRQLCFIRICVEIKLNELSLCLSQSTLNIWWITSKIVLKENLQNAEKIILNGKHAIQEN